MTTTLEGLRKDDLNIIDVEQSVLREHPGAEGYVKRGLISNGDIHTRFDLDEDRTCHNIIHEATHKFINTDDLGYISTSFALFITLRAQGIPGNPPINNANGVRNADSFATFVMRFT